jgi:hypothetical protein
LNFESEVPVLSQLFEMRLTKDQAEWVIHMDEIKEGVEQEINELQRLALQLANYIGGVRSDIELLTGKSALPFPEDDRDDDFMAQIVQRMNGRGVM